MNVAGALRWVIPASCLVATALAADAPTVALPDAPLKLPAAPPSAVEREAAVELPPMIVAETSTSPPWLYATVDDTEYLSRCSMSLTRAYITTQLEIRRLLRVYVPADFFARSAVPIVSILAPEASKAGDDVAAREMERMQQQATLRANEADREGGRVSSALRFRFLPNLRLDDRDMLAVFTYLSDRDLKQLVASPDYVYARLIARTPMLPAWLIEGVGALYSQATFRDQPITMVAASWISRDDTAALRRDPESRRVLFPVSELFAAGALAGEANRNPARVDAWRAEVVLFVRWALDPANAPAADALWKFARRASVEPATEALFTECFGFGYADLQERLSDYLPTAVKGPVRIQPGRLPPLPRFEVKRATPEQIARLRGEWERLEIPFVRGKHPEFLPRYIEQARTTLLRSAGRGARDPLLLAAIGLCELDAGDESAARPWLEQAAAMGVVRPRVHYEVGRLRWLDLTRYTGEKSGFTRTQIEPVLEPLRRAALLAPPLPEVYLLMADACLRCREPVIAEDLATLAAGAPLFRRVAGIALRVALLHARVGQRTEAMQLLDTAGPFVTEESTRADFQQLRAALASPSSPTPAR